jgi:hypothetical protein
MKALLDLFKQVQTNETFDAIKIGLASPENPFVVLRRSQSRKPSTTVPSSLSATAVLRQDLWPDQGLRMPVR